MKHTPTPWSLGTGIKSYCVCSNLPDTSPSSIIAENIYTLDDADFIVRAVNNHEALEATNTKLLAALDKIRDIATAGLSEADKRNLMAAVGSLRVIQHGASAAIKAASTTSGEEPT